MVRGIIPSTAGLLQAHAVKYYLSATHLAYPLTHPFPPGRTAVRLPAISSHDDVFYFALVGKGEYVARHFWHNPNMIRRSFVSFGLF